MINSLSTIKSAVGRLNTDQLRAVLQIHQIDYGDDWSEARLAHAVIDAIDHSKIPHDFDFIYLHLE